MTERPHIVFVDDEPMILSGLRRMLHSRREAWDMSFAVGATEALATLEARRCDVIISDYRMPGMDGAALLQVVRDRYPGTGRVILSGHADERELLKVVMLAHRFIHKPCREDQIVSTVERVVGLRTTLANEDVRRAIEDVDALPSPPNTLHDLLAALNNEDASAHSVGEVIARDPATAAKVLQLVNSSSFTLGHRITDVSQAVALLGLRHVQALVLMHDLVRSFDTKGATSAEWVQQLTSHSVETSRLARHLAAGAPWADDAFAAGLLVEIGQLVLASSRPEMFATQLAVWRQGEPSLADIETVTFGVSHADVGAYLLNLWGLPATMIEAVVGHLGATPATRPDDVVSTVALAHAIVEAEVGAVCGGRSGEEFPIDEEQLSEAQIRGLDRWRRERARHR